jgi:hypothetical protein
MIVSLRHRLVILTTRLVISSFQSKSENEKKSERCSQSSSNQRLVIRLVRRFLEGKLVNGDECDECDDSYTNTIH